MEIKAPRLVKTKVSKQADPPSQVGSGPAFASILNQLLLSVCGAWAGGIHIAWLDLTHWHAALFEIRRKRAMR